MGGGEFEPPLFGQSLGRPAPDSNIPRVGYGPSSESKIDAGFDFGSPDHVRVLKSVLIKACDVSNECRPPRVSEVWVDRLLQEYFAQSDKEKRQGLPVQKHMDRDHVTKPGAQIGFITYILLPMFEVLAKVLPEIQAMSVAPLLSL